MAPPAVTHGPAPAAMCFIPSGPRRGVYRYKGNYSIGLGGDGDMATLMLYLLLGIFSTRNSPTLKFSKLYADRGSIIVAFLLLVSTA